MTVWILVLAFFYNGTIFTANFTNGGPTAVEFKSKEACEKRRAIDQAHPEAYLPDGASLLKLECIPRTSGA